MSKEEDERGEQEDVVHGQVQSFINSSGQTGNFYATNGTRILCLRDISTNSTLNISYTFLRQKTDSRVYASHIS